MITEFVINGFIVLGNGLIAQLPEIRIAIPDSILTTIFILISNLGDIVPVKQLLPILAISAAIKSAQIGWAILLRLKSFIPTWGN